MKNYLSAKTLTIFTAGLVILMFPLLTKAFNPFSFKTDTTSSKKDRLFRKMGVLSIPHIAEAIDFTLKDLNGNPVRISDFRGNIVLLNFWTTWCPECRIEMPSMQKLHSRFKDNNFVLVSISIKETAAEVRSFFKKYKFLGLGLVIGFLFYLYGLMFFLHQYFVHQKVHRPWYRMYEMKELVKEVSEREDDYDKIVMTKNETEPYVFFLFYNKVEPIYYQKRSSKLNWKGTWTIDNYIFDQRDCPLLQEESPKENRLYVERGICKLEPWIKVIDEIKCPDGSTALRLEEFDKSKFKTKKE